MLAVLVARNNIHLNQIRANSLAQLEIIWEKQARIMSSFRITYILISVHIFPYEESLILGLIISVIIVMIGTFTRKMEEVDMNSEMLPIRSLCEIMSKDVLTPQQMQDVAVGRESLDFRLTHAKDAQPMIWTLRQDDDSRDGGFFTGWREFREKNDIRKDCTLVLIRHSNDPQRTLTVVGS